MNNKFEYQNLSSDTSRNQFMVSESSFVMSPSPVTQLGPKAGQMQKIFDYMKNVMSNRMLMDQMERFFNAKQSMNNSSFVPRQSPNFPMQRVGYQERMQPNPKMNYTREQQIQAYESVSNNGGKFQSYINQSTSFKVKGNNPETPIVTQQTRENYNIVPLKDNKNKQNEIAQKKNIVSFDDMPIKSTYIAQYQSGTNDRNYQNTSNLNQKNESEFYGKSSKYSEKQTVQVNTKIPKKNDNRAFNQSEQFDDRPINGTKKDFKQLLKQKFQESPFDEKPLPALSKNNKNPWDQAQEYQHENNQNGQGQGQEGVKPKKQFLKRGSRQYLSSAKDKKPPKKPTQAQNLNTSKIQSNRNNERSKTPVKRDVSQTRVLGKRNTTSNDMSKSNLKMNASNSAKNNLNLKNQQQSFHKSQTQQNLRSIPKAKTSYIPPPPKNTKKSQNSIHNNSLTNRYQKKVNVFADDSSDEDQQGQQQNQDTQTNQKYISNQNRIFNKLPQKQVNMFTRQKKQQVVDGVFLTKTQLSQIIEKYGNAQPQKPVSNGSEEKFNELRKKYTDLCNLVEKQKQQHQAQMMKEKEQFQNYKLQQIQKLKNEKRVMERQMKSSMPSQSQNLQKDKEQIESLKIQLQKERQQHKKKEKTNNILIEKYKKQNQQLKFKLQRAFQDIENKSSAYQTNNSSKPHTSDRQIFNNRSSVSQSKSTSKTADISKTQNNKSQKKLERKEEQESANDRNYKKTVPFSKKGNTKDHGSDKNLSSRNIQGDKSEEDENLPTFKVDNKRVTETKQKKYQFVEQTDESNQFGKKENKFNQAKTTGKTTKNVFCEQSSQDERSNHSNQDNSQDNNQPSFNSTPKFQSLQQLMSQHFSVKNITPQLINNLFRYQNNSQYRQYKQRLANPRRIITNSSKNSVDNKLTNIYSDKSKEILFQNGVKKEIFEDGYTIIYFKNGDIKQKLSDGTIFYYFKEKQVDQITLVNGMNIYRFENNQVELHYDGGKYIEIRHPDGTVKMLGNPIH